MFFLCAFAPLREVLSPDSRHHKSHHRRSPFRCGAAQIATTVLMRKISGMPRIGARNAAYFDSSSRTTKVSRGAAIRSQFIPSGAFGSEAMTVSLLSGFPPRSR